MSSTGADGPASGGGASGAAAPAPATSPGGFGGAATYIAVVGPGADDLDPALLAAAEEAGAAVAAAGAVLVCGGLGGVMEAASRGARSRRGLVVGLLPGDDREAANGWVSVALPTGLGELRNGLVVRCADALVAVGGSHGTLSEVALALRTGVPVVGVSSFDLDGVVPAADAASAVAAALEAAAARRG